MRHVRSPCHREVSGDAQATQDLQRCRPPAREGLNRNDRSLYRDRRNDARTIGILRHSGGDVGRFHSVEGLAKATGFVELRSRPEPWIGRRIPTPETALLKGLPSRMAAGGRAMKTRIPALRSPPVLRWLSAC